MKNKTTLYLSAIALLAAASIAQAPKTQALLMAMKANGKQVVTYQWKQKSTIVRKGETAAFTIEEIRFDAAGQRQRVQIAQSEERRLGPIASRKAAEIKSSIREAMQLASRYANPQDLSLAVQRGELWEGPGGLRVRARSVILPIDEVTMDINSQSYLTSRVDVQTQHEGSPVAIAIDYQRLPNGPNMLTRMTVRIPKQDVVVNVESYDFVRLASPMNPVTSLQ